MNWNILNGFCEISELKNVIIERLAQLANGKDEDEKLEIQSLIAKVMQGEIENQKIWELLTQSKELGKITNTRQQEEPKREKIEEEDSHTALIEQPKEGLWRRLKKLIFREKIITDINGNKLTYEGIEDIENIIITDPNYVKNVDWNRFSNVRKITFENVETIVKCDWPKTLEEVVISTGVKKIESKAFSDSSLKKVEIEEGLETIGKSAFAHTKLTEVEIPDSVREIHGWCFFQTPLKNVKIGKGVKLICQDTFCCTFLENVKIPDNVEKIEKEAFDQFKIKEIELGEGKPIIEAQGKRGESGFVKIIIKFPEQIENIQNPKSYKIVDVTGKVYSEEEIERIQKGTYEQKGKETDRERNAFVTSLVAQPSGQPNQEEKVPESTNDISKDKESPQK